MKFKLAGVLLSAALFSASAPAWADGTINNQGRFFGKIYGGASMLGDQDLSQTGVAAAGAGP